MNTPSKEALEAAVALLNGFTIGFADGLFKPNTSHLAAIIDSYFEPLRKRLAEMESLLESEKATRNAIIAKGQHAEARVKELEAAAKCDPVVYRKIKLAEQENELSALRAANAELQKQESESRRLFYSEQDKRQSAEFRCEELAEALRPFAEFANKWDKNPIRGLDDALYSIHNEASLRLSDCKTARAALAHHAAGEPAKHPDTEIIDRFEEMCGSLEYCDADEVRNHWRAYGYSGSNEGVGRTMRDALRAAIDAARKEVQP